MVADPSLKEEAASSGGLTVTLNPHGELCAVQKARGVGLPAAEIMRCIRIAAQKVRRQRGVGRGPAAGWACAPWGYGCICGIRLALGAGCWVPAVHV
jgi:hypothetical protein